MISQKYSVSGIDCVRRPTNDEDYKDNEQRERNSTLLDKDDVFVGRCGQNHT